MHYDIPVESLDDLVESRIFEGPLAEVLSGQPE